ncbi:MAG: leucine--tRNA ligase [Myxococcota bacterium]|jgi:leucyl-tRNA synthetase|nr:leucine--tRNA ligase [Myxococcota bacterium]
MAYDHSTIEARWQAYWLENETFRAEIDHSKPKYYALDMFPYPSGDGLHVGHPEGYTATDIVSRYKRMRGFNVLHPMGWDAFGLPAEQYAIKTGTHPRVTTKNNVDNFRRQIRSLGFSYDWSREIDTTAPDYVRWTQWIFCKLYEKDLAYLAEVPVNWCPALGTVLSNEEVIDGKSEIGSHPVVRVPMRQWMLRITRYADRLIEDLEELDWPEPIKKMQRDWIGRSEGAQVRFSLASDPSQEVEVFTTRPDTLFGATYMVLAPEHELVAQITTAEQRAAVDAYVEASQRKSERARIADTHEKTGVSTGAFATNPVNGQEIPIWIADYVLAGYGTGAIMAVPGHDERDYAFAKTFELPIVEVVTGGNLDEAAFVGTGKAVNSDFLDGLDTSAAKSRMNEWLEEKGIGEATITYKLRDWLFSRQRYWGEPFPVVHHENGEIALVPEDSLPVTLPELDDYKPSGSDFQSPLARVPDWIETTDPATGETVSRDPNTMPQWAGSCWYFLRFLDPKNENEAWSEEAAKYWMPVDLYIGGAEHAVLHLLYARFWHKVFYDLGLVHTKEPFHKLVNQGMILGNSYRYYDDNPSDDANADAQVFAASDAIVDGESVTAASDGRELKTRWVPLKDVVFPGDGSARHPEHEDLELELVVEKMSKSRGNVISPDEVIEQFGADSMRLYEMFLGPLEKAAPWSTDGIMGIFRFLQRTWRLVMEDNRDAEDTLREFAPGSGGDEEARLVAKTIAGVTEDIDEMRFNTAISKLMVMVRELGNVDQPARESIEALVLLLSPMAPHISEELWRLLGHEQTLAYEPWPVADESLLTEDTVTLVLQVNGKKRDEIEVPADASKESIEALALASEKVQKHLDGREPKKVVVVPGRLVNVVG